jgi:hypothetical protein
MKTIFILSFVGMLFPACRTRDTNEEIQKILEQKNYQIEVTFQGCFGAGTERLEIKNNEVAVYTYQSLSNIPGSSEKTWQIPWDIEKQKILKEIFETGISFHDTVEFCTTTSEYKLTNFVQSVEFKDMTCELTDKFAALLK